MNASRFSVLVDRLKSLSPQDEAEFQRARAEISDLKLVLEKIRQRELADFLGAADAMIRSINVLDGEPFGQIRELVCDLLDVVGDSVAGLGGQSSSASEDCSPKPASDEQSRQPAGGLGRSPLTLAGETPAETYGGIRTMSELLLGQLLVESEKITRAQLIAALKHQKNQDRRIGEALIELGFVSQEDVDEALARQYKLAEEHTSSQASHCASAIHEMRLGQILVRVCGVSEEDLTRALQIQRATGKRLGEAIVELGVVTWERVEKAAQIQGNPQGSSDSGLNPISRHSLRLDD